MGCIVLNPENYNTTRYVPWVISCLWSKLWSMKVSWPLPTRRKNCKRPRCWNHEYVWTTLNMLCTPMERVNTPNKKTHPHCPNKTFLLDLLRRRIVAWKDRTTTKVPIKRRRATIPKASCDGTWVQHSTEIVDAMISFYLKYINFISWTFYLLTPMLQVCERSEYLYKNSKFNS